MRVNPFGPWVDFHYSSIDIRGLRFKPKACFHVARVNQRIEFLDVVQTPLHFGGYRTWLVCGHCQSHVVQLFVDSHNSMYCRHCLKLSYESGNESKLHRDCRAARTIREKLDWMPSIEFIEQTRPKGMWHKKFNRLLAKHRQRTKQAVMMLRAEGWL